MHLYGIAYKADVGDYRESPAIDIVRLLEDRGAVVSYTDPHVPVVDDHGVSMTGLAEADALAAGVDCAVIVTNHRAFDYDALVRTAPLIVDTRNALKGRSEPHIFRL